MVYALATEGLPAEARAAFDQMLEAKPEGEAPRTPDPVIEKNRELAAFLGMPIPEARS